MRVTFAFMILFFAGIAASDVKVVPKPGQWVRDGTSYPNQADCIAAAKAELGSMTLVCAKLDRVLMYGDCADVPAPPFTPTLTAHDCPNSEAKYSTETRQVATGEWPTCWAVVEVNVGPACPP